MPDRTLTGRWPRPRRSGRSIGLDLGSASIKLVELEQTSTGPRLVNHVLQELPLAPGGDPQPRLSWLQAVLKEGKASAVHLAIAGPEVIIRCVTVPPMSVEELVEAVKWQVKDLLPFPVQEAVLDFEILGEVWEKDIKKLDVLVAAAPLRLIQEQIELVTQAGATVVSITPTALAVHKTVQALSPERLAGSVAIIEWGASSAHVFMVQEGHLRLAREAPIGSAEITQALVGISPAGRHEPLDAAKAESIKRHYGIPTENLEGLIEDGVPLGQLAALIHVVLDKLMTELRRVFDFYHVHVYEGSLERLLVIGGGANLRNLPTALREGLGVAVDCYNPVLMLSHASSTAGDVAAEEGPRLAAAIGAALGQGQGMNLIPAELKARRRRAAIRSRLRRIGALAGGAVVALYGLLLLMAWSEGHRLHALEREWQTFDPVYRRSMEMAQQTRRMDGVMASVERFRREQPVWEGIFKELSHITPPGVVLTDCTLTRRDWTLRGISASQSAGEGALARFLEALASSVFFRHARLRNSQLQVGAEGTTTFEIVGELK